MASSTKEVALRLKAAAEAAIGSIGLGYDVTEDLRLKYCKGSAGRLIGIDDEFVRDVVVPGGILIQNVSKSINCGKGERVRFGSDIWSFQKMAEQFNQDVSLSGRIPTGQFNAAFEFTGSWQKDAANTKALASDGVYITLYNITLEKSQITLRDHVKKAVPSTWEPAALAKFIEKYGTHVIAGVKMGGKDIVYMKQQHSSTLPSDDVQRKLKEIAEKRFSGQHIDNPRKSRDLELLEKNDYGLINLNPAIEDITFFWRRRGGSYAKNLDHRTWCQTVQLEPEVISMSFVPITSLLSGIDGNGFLTHAINLYLRYKPPIEELQQFLEFQLPTRWAPEFGVLAVGPEGKQQHNASLQFKFLGPKLYVNTNQVDVGNTPVTGLRLYLEGKRNDCLAVHLQHLSSVPKNFKLVHEPSMNMSPNLSDRRYHEKVQWKSFSHICTAPVESDDELSIVTGAEFEVSDAGLKRVLFLRLHFSKVMGASVVKSPEWDGSPVLSQKSGIVSTLISARFSSASNAQKPPPQPKDINVNSALPVGPPVSSHGKKLLKFVDTTELIRGPQDLPGYWVVSGARLMVDKSKISLRVKFSLLAVIPGDDQTALD
ncbi:perforin domain-containing protein [Tanacetum coccineum]